MCGHDRFWQREAQLHTGLATFFNLEWAQTSAVCIVCAPVDSSTDFFPRNELWGKEWIRIYPPHFGKHKWVSIHYKYKAEVAQGTAMAQKLGIPAVPGFVVASVDPQNPKKVKGISFIGGALPFANFQKELDIALSANN